MAALEREAEALRLKADAERRRGEELARERDLLTKLRTQAEGASHRQVYLPYINTLDLWDEGAAGCERASATCATSCACRLRAPPTARRTPSPPFAVSTGVTKP